MRNPDLNHGTLYGFLHGCRCIDCCAVKSTTETLFNERHRNPKNPYRISDGAAMRALDRPWHRPDPEARARAIYQYRPRKKSADTRDIPLRDWLTLVERYRHRCAYCGEKRTLTKDHVIPLAKGGRHAIGNILPACKPCNTSKADKLLYEWRASRAFKGVDLWHGK